MLQNTVASAQVLLTMYAQFLREVRFMIEQGELSVFTVLESDPILSVKGLGASDFQLIANSLILKGWICSEYCDHTVLDLPFGVSSGDMYELDFGLLTDAENRELTFSLPSPLRSISEGVVEVYREAREVWFRDFPTTFWFTDMSTEHSKGAHFFTEAVRYIGDISGNLAYSA